MSSKKILLGAVALTAIALGVYFLFFRPSDEQRIRDAIARALGAVTLTADDDNPITRLGRIKGVFKDVVDKDVRVNVPDVPQLHAGRDELAVAAAQMNSWFRTAEISVGSMEIKLDDAHRSAQVRATATLDGASRDGRRRHEEREVTMLVTNAESTWRIATITVWPPKDER
jgi:hypothetical protein